MVGWMDGWMDGWMMDGWGGFITHQSVAAMKHAIIEEISQTLCGIKRAIRKVYLGHQREAKGGRKRVVTEQSNTPLVGAGDLGGKKD